MAGKNTAFRDLSHSEPTSIRLSIRWVLHRTRFFVFHDEFLKALLPIRTL
jgi:hypothetical protein